MLMCAVFISVIASSCNLSLKEIIVTPEARTQAIIEMLELVETTPRPADAVIGSYFRSRRYIGAKDRTALAETAYTMLRNHARLNWWCNHYHNTPTVRLRLIAWLRLVQEEDEPTINRTFAGGKFAPAIMNETERKFLDRLKGHDVYIHPKMSLAVRYEMPEWILPQLTAQYGDRIETEMAALLAPAPLDLRANPVKATRETVSEELSTAGASVTPCRYAPYGLRLAARLALPSLPAFREGRVEVQDEGSQLVALLVDAKPGMRVVDFCAGAGGKTLAIAAMMANKGRIYALDVLDKRLTRAAERFRRSGLHNIETHAISSASDPWIKRHKGGFDRVLVDAPCGGSGTWRRNPDARWRDLGPGLTTLLPLQQEILTSAARLVKPGGRLIYATCSLLDVENTDQVTQFLAQHPDFTLVPYQTIWQTVTSNPAPCAGDTLQLTPAQHDTDGFFTAVLERKANTVIKTETTEPEAVTPPMAE